MANKVDRSSSDVITLVVSVVSDDWWQWHFRHYKEACCHFRMGSSTKYLQTGSAVSGQSTCGSGSRGGTNGRTRFVQPGPTMWKPSKVTTVLLVGSGLIVTLACPLRKGRSEPKEMGRQQSLLGLQSRLARTQPVYEEGQAGARERSFCRAAACSCQDNQSRNSSAYNVFMGWTAAELHG